MDDLRTKINKLVNDYPNADDVMITNQIMGLVDSEVKAAMLRQRAFDQKLINKEVVKARIDELEALKMNTWSTDKCWNELNERLDKLKTLADTESNKEGAGNE